MQVYHFHDITIRHGGEDWFISIWAMQYFLMFYGYSDKASQLCHIKYSINILEKDALQVQYVC